MTLNDFLNFRELQLRRISNFIGVDYELLNGNTVPAKAASIFNYCKDHKLLSEIENYMRTYNNYRTSSERGNLTKRFKIALSFPGECRYDIIKPIANELVKRFNDVNSILYDDFHKSEFARPNLDNYLQDLYHNQSELIVVCLCSHYNKKSWCGLEWRAIRDLLNSKNDDEIMFLRADDGEVDGVFGTIDGYIEVSKYNIDEVVDCIIERYNFLHLNNK